MEGLSLLINREVNLGLLEAKLVGREKAQIYLQYADDTILACTGKIKNVKIIKYILRLFELILGSKLT